MVPQARGLLVLVSDDRLRDSVAEVEGDDLEAHRVRPESYGVLQTDDEPVHSPDLLERKFHRGAPAVGIAGRELARTLDLRADRGERSLQLMDGCAEEVRLRPLRRVWAARVREDRDRVGAGRWLAPYCAPEHGEEFFDDEGLGHRTDETSVATARRGARTLLRDRLRVRGEHQDRECRMIAPDHGRVVPRSRAAGSVDFAVEDHAPRIEAIDRVTDLIVIGDRDDVVPRFFDEGGHELTEEHVVLDKKHGDCSCMIGALGDHKPMLVLRTHDVQTISSRVFLPLSPRYDEGAPPSECSFSVAREGSYGLGWFLIP